MNENSLINNLSSLRRLKFLSEVLREISEESQKENFSSELQVRYSSRAYESGETFPENLEEEFGLNRKLWKILSSKQRRLVYQLAILAGISDYLRFTLEGLLRGSLGDPVIRDILEQRISQNHLYERLLELETKDIRYLARMVGDLQRLLRSHNKSFRDLFKIETFLREKRKNRRQVRHKGYRDHGSLGKDSTGLSEEQQRKYIREEGNQLFYEEEGYLPEEISSWFENPLLFQNIWIFSVEV